MASSFIKVLKHNLVNFPGWRTSRKIIVIESDDWGSIRMSSKKAYDFFLKKGYPVDKNPYNRYDSLESNLDMEILLDTLSSVTDKNGNPALLTLNNVVGNPDFERIKESEYSKYYCETFDKTLNKYPAHDKVMALYHEGINKRLIRPQYHGREHLNISRWMRDLKSGNKALLDAFDKGMYSLHSENNPVYRNEYLDELDFDTLDQITGQAKMLNEGYEIF